MDVVTQLRCLLGLASFDSVVIHSMSWLNLVAAGAWWPDRLGSSAQQHDESQIISASLHCAEGFLLCVAQHALPGA